MKNKYQILTTRSVLAAYYGWEYGVKRANEILKAARPVQGSLYEVRELTRDSLKLKRNADNLAERVKLTVAQFQARKNNTLSNNPLVFVEKI